MIAEVSLLILWIFSCLPVSSHICGGPFGYTYLMQAASIFSETLESSTDLLSTDVFSVSVVHDVLSNSDAGDNAKIDVSSSCSTQLYIYRYVFPWYHFPAFKEGRAGSP
jgi:hypothetical protein